MWSQFLLENVHFAVSLFVAFVFFAIFWLHWDAWLKIPSRRDFFRLVGFLFLAVSFVASAVNIESGLASNSFFSVVISGIAVLTRICGYFLVLAGMILDPLPKHPKVGEEKWQRAVIGLGLPFSVLQFLFSIGAASVAFMYLRRATIGLERHMRGAVAGYFLLSIAHLFGLAVLFRDTNDPFVYGLVAPFALFWLLERFFLLLGGCALGLWVWQYLLTRTRVQLFMVFVGYALVIFLVTVTVFLSLLLVNIRNVTLLQIDSDNRVMNIALEGKRAELAAYAEIYSKDSYVISAIKNNDLKTLEEKTRKNVADWKLSSLVVLNSDGVVLARGENPERVGESLSDSSIYKNAIEKVRFTTVDVAEGAVAPVVSVRAVETIVIDDKRSAIIIVGFTIDNAYMDGIAEATGLEFAVYGNNILAASTIPAPDGNGRWIGVKEVDPIVLEKVISNGKTVTVLKRVSNTPYLASFAPLWGLNGEVVGMVFVGKPESSIISLAAQSLRLTFLVTGILIILSLFPAYALARHFAFELR